MNNKICSKLEKDVEEFVLSKFKGIKCVDEIFVKSHFSISKSYYDINDNLYTKLYKSKKILQLMINAYNDYELYKNYKIKFVPVYGDGSLLEFRYKCISDSGIFLSQPDKSDIIKSLFDYSVCLLSLNLLENSVKVSPNEIDKCTFCDNILKRGDVECSTCKCSVEEMVAIAVNNVTNVYDSVHDKVIPEADNEVVMDNRGNLGNIRDQGNNITTRSVIGIDEKKKSTMWRCGQCGCFNAYICANCTTCGTLMEEGIWSCGQCTLDNSCADNACTACGAMNISVTMMDNIATGGVEMKGQCIDNHPCDKCGSLMGDNGKCGKCIDKVTFRKDQWTCGTCGKMHSYCENICNSCGVTKIIGGKWRCAKCIFVNDCKNIKCDVCDEKNDIILARYCIKCKVVAVTTNKQLCEDCEKHSNPKYQPKQWHCPYPRCDVDNSDGDQYCCTCRLQRGYSRARGDNVKVWYDNKECIVWMCYKCHVINKQHELVCHSCQETRFKKKFCKTCKKYNDGTTNNCDKCYQRL